MSDFKRQLRSYIDGLEQPVSIQEAMERGSKKRRYPVPRAVLAGAAVVMVPALVLVGLRLLPAEDGEVVDTTLPPTTETIVIDTTTTIIESTEAPTSFTVPDLNGLDIETATRVAEEAGFEIEVTEMYPSRSDFGLITAQGPLAGDTVDEPGSVIVVGIRVEAPCLAGIDEPVIGEGSMPVTVLFECAGEGHFPDVTSPVVRAVPSNPDEIEATLLALLAGLTEEERAMGYSSFFSAQSANAVNFVLLDGDRLIVDFNDGILIGNASTTTGGLYFGAELRANLFRFPEVQEIEFRLNGSCEAYYNWLQGNCEIATRASWEALVEQWLTTDEEHEVDESTLARTFTAAYGDGNAIDELVGASRNESPYVELGGWLVASGPNLEVNKWAIHVGSESGEEVWLVDEIGHTNEGHLVYTVRAVLELPWDEVMPDITADAFVRSGAFGCSLDGDYPATLVAIAQIDGEDDLSEEMIELRAWLIDIDRNTIDEISTDGVECYMEVGG